MLQKMESENMMIEFSDEIFSLKERIHSTEKGNQVSGAENMRRLTLAEGIIREAEIGTGENITGD